MNKLIRIIYNDLYRLYNNNTIIIVLILLLLSGLFPLLSSRDLCWYDLIGITGLYAINPLSISWIIALLIGYRLFSDDIDTGFYEIILSKPLKSYDYVIGRLVAGIVIGLLSYLLIGIVLYSISIFIFNSNNCLVQLIDVIKYSILAGLLILPLMLATSIGGLYGGSSASIQFGIGIYVISTVITIMAYISKLTSNIENLPLNLTTSNIIKSSLSLYSDISVLNPFTSIHPILLGLSNIDLQSYVFVKPSYEYAMYGIILSIATSIILIISHLFLINHKLK